MRKLVQWIIDLLLLRHLVRLVAYLRRPGEASEGDDQSATLEEVPIGSEQQARRAKFWRRIGTSLLIGIVIEVMLIAGHWLQLPILVATEDAAMDFVMRQFRNVKWPDEHTVFVLLEADQTTFEMWGEPFYFHRKRIQEMIEFASGYYPDREPEQQTARGAGPALIIVDVDLSKPGLKVDSEELKNYLKKYSSAENNPPLILMRTLKNPTEDEPAGAVRRERTSFLDPVVNDVENKNIFWASPHYQRDEDYRIRRWLLWLQTRVEDKRSVLPSVQLLTQKLLNEDPKEEESSAVKRHQQLIENLCAIARRDDPSAEAEQAASCGAESVEGERAEREITIHRAGTKHYIDLGGSPTSQRLIYTIPYETREGERRPKVGSNLIFDRESAMRLAKLDPSFLEGSVVVIGGTYRESRDWYATPIGEMPGAMVVINAIHSLGANGTLEPPGPVLRLTIVVLLVLMMSLIFAQLSSFFSFLVASALVLILLVPVSFLMFRFGVWVDFALPLVAVQLHEFAAEFESIDPKSRKRARKKAEAEQAASDDASESVEAATTNDSDAAV